MSNVEQEQMVETIDGQQLAIGPPGVLRAGDPNEAVDSQQVQRALQWLGQTQPTEEPMVNSHWLTQFVENWAGSRISHGALILAAFRAGFPIGRDRDAHTPNVTIGVSPQCINEYDCGCGHP